MWNEYWSKIDPDGNVELAEGWEQIFKKAEYPVTYVIVNKYMKNVAIKNQQIS